VVGDRIIQYYPDRPPRFHRTFPFASGSDPELVAILLTGLFRGDRTLVLAYRPHSAPIRDRPRSVRG